MPHNMPRLPGTQVGVQRRQVGERVGARCLGVVGLQHVRAEHRRVQRARAQLVRGAGLRQHANNMNMIAGDGRLAWAGWLPAPAPLVAGPGNGFTA